MYFMILNNKINHYGKWGEHALMGAQITLEEITIYKRIKNAALKNPIFWAPRWGANLSPDADRHDVDSK